jgi:hypothetical protein
VTCANNSNENYFRQAQRFPLAQIKNTDINNLNANRLGSNGTAFSSFPGRQDLDLGVSVSDDGRGGGSHVLPGPLV